MKIEECGELKRVAQKFGAGEEARPDSGPYDKRERIGSARLAEEAAIAA
jgi:hypothetical protein